MNLQPETLFLCVAVLMLGFPAKQYLCDFVLENNGMLADQLLVGRHNLRKHRPVNHLALHALATCLLTSTVLFISHTLSPLLSVAVTLGACALDVICHGMADSWSNWAKRGRGPYQRGYWIVLGVDQLFRNWSHVFLSALILMAIIAPTMVSK